MGESGLCPITSLLNRNLSKCPDSEKHFHSKVISINV